MEAHGGYLCRYEDVDVAWLLAIARDAAVQDGAPIDDCGLTVTVLGSARLVRFAYDAPITYGRAGARWYAANHTLASRLSEHFSNAVHAYAFDPDLMEQVSTYARGRRVGGERLMYDDVELPEDDEDESAFQKMTRRWPVGRLATILGVEREQLLKLPRAPSTLLELSKPTPPGPLWQLLPGGLSSFTFGQLAVAR